jgi:hypothetical protein
MKICFTALSLSLIFTSISPLSAQCRESKIRKEKLMTNLHRVLTTIAIICITACSTKKSPNFYPNDKLREVSVETTKEDTKECMALADDYVKSPEKYKEVAGSTAKAGVIGSAAGAVGGAIVGNAGRGTAVGAASGAVVALLQGLWKIGDRDPSYERFVEHCLQEKGYKIYGWS